MWGGIFNIEIKLIIYNLLMAFGISRGMCTTVTAKFD